MAYDQIAAQCVRDIRTLHERIEALEKVARDAATSLETISQLAGRKSYGDPPIQTFMEAHAEVRAYAASRARIAREALQDASGVQPTRGGQQ